MTQRSKKKKVLIFGSFDFLHAGHFHFFEFAKSKGDSVIVVIARDNTIVKLKGSKPFHSEQDRKKMLEQIKYIDEVYLGDKKDVYKIIKKINPDMIVLGYDQSAFIDKLDAYIAENNLITKIIRAKAYKEKVYKSSKIKKYLNKFV
ncbi:MAG: hypothetical protein A2725_04455 [Candidatus Magasanikbacteria bacterium RIFCSPHIGHO2_01_FULL_33_34]|uniref:Cytidyltransferase-like domain-containing protein n=1 Tax=Candidatus Magasanikbacteria bacterium RIFCSPHIGHO2_01_FULL_33_34 TaxID=1798671 RepID=A0A1F6LHR2_9BACT|nr:MAG: hypothetical protein A2725_04455 [Candidatus Magasanikbacteria bacterium RIFCSPHIGHO2_01_FULL_33_34]OGH65215.1 MAG: hypothetical protein A3B83_04215 [Candidatus Magasanikbacteria bacterium RIFCSPHIGHO2_02_FULL_33_17]OGH75240.1 MAG: hypothetical protein A3A89_03950 [Candidatus Magasanikbacteria bacterium RIFCSPLOWO2_01_FULL_33_34]OGH82162.1 MAG: hypothetical protein A3F93_00345 [Candidatus Magasanikbacteria bacterium RIFCSPLOWO2_12_FULL_34_7]